MEPLEQEIFLIRLRTVWPDVCRPLERLYGRHPHYQTWLHKFVHIIAQAYANRPRGLRLLDLQRTAEPDWFQQSHMLGYVCYTDRFAGNLHGVRDKIPYLRELGVTYLHLMPLLQPRQGANDGGYAVSDYRQVHEKLGTDCENQPEAHYILQAFRALSRIAAPGLLLKAEAIVSPPQLVPYLGRGEAANKECELAYHNVFMVMLWSALAERKVGLLTHALQNMPAIPSATSWCTYMSLVWCEIAPGVACLSW
jgi:hypothetical protein